MAGLSLNAGLRAGGSSMSPAVPASQVAPSTAAFGSGGVSPTNGPSAAGTTAGHWVTYTEIAAGAALGLLWWSTPESEHNQFGRMIFGMGLFFVFFGGVRTWGRVALAEGENTGFMGALHKIAALT